MENDPLARIRILRTADSRLKAHFLFETRDAATTRRVGFKGEGAEWARRGAPPGGPGLCKAKGAAVASLQQRFTARLKTKIRRKLKSRTEQFASPGQKYL